VRRGHWATSPALRLLAMDGDRPRQWTDRSCLRQVQYRTDANLAARQSHAHQHPRIDLPATVLSLSALRGQQIEGDIGCGNGAYLAELGRRGHTGPVVGMDLSAGMLAATRRRTRAAALTAADAAALPLRDHAVSLTLAGTCSTTSPIPAPPSASRAGSPGPAGRCSGDMRSGGWRAVGRA
jgi:SAM-dependent methyltransferase